MSPARTRCFSSLRKPRVATCSQGSGRRTTASTRTHGSPGSGDRLRSPAERGSGGRGGASPPERNAQRGRPDLRRRSRVAGARLPAHATFPVTDPLPRGPKRARRRASPGRTPWFPAGTGTPLIAV
ncbi:Heme chaperone--apocytochrome heme-lyase [Roseomonas mucosa]|uniref:Heme chaperone--apocytochrome heme-lyase n=1 Tax=Roseomonas mucosa TaxID=207340 RepID=A0A4Y1MT20_9PROT|nr:Heme chaperone--apocytochrome heme-lyase [Roseomonas mucosa]QDD93295.1 Heme chaperone--apocytochrome heme-lyase [Roseomonas mucosa]QDD98398.1 Heme chaperone--apocytochrome heme-lyase [Roseomonas mucosa]UZO90592.1 Heme chaperone--apocytochrome heme-lyase [Roseomonas mucosa]